jgi:phosphoribosyl 1,2-cyclic phosphodiesterase
VIAASGETIVVDAGSGIRALGNRLLREKRLECNLFFTHSHWDHILGFPFFKPIYHADAKICVHGCPLAQGNMEMLLAKTMAPPYFPVPFKDIVARMEYVEACSEPLHIGSVRISSIALSHPNLGLGYRFEEGGKSFVFLTDNELGHPHRGGRSFAEYAAFCRGADLLLHDAEYDETDYIRTRGWGHSLYHDALELAITAGVRRFGLFHHNQDRSDSGIDAMVADCNERLRGRGHGDMDCFATRQGDEYHISSAQ